MLFMDNKGELREDTPSEVVRVENFIDNIRQINLQVQEELKKLNEKYKERHDQLRVKKTFKVGDKLWLHLNTQRL